MSAGTAVIDDTYWPRTYGSGHAAWRTKKQPFVFLDTVTCLRSGWGRTASRSWTVPRVHRESGTAVAEARAVLDEIEASGKAEVFLSERTKEQVLRFLARVTDENSTYASIVPDDDGIAVLHWVAGSRALQVDVGDSGPNYLWMRDAGQTRYSTDPAAIYHIAETVLGAMAVDAHRADPNWRRRMRRS